MDICRGRGRGFRLADGPCRVQLVNSLVKIKENRLGENVRPGPSKFEQCRPSLLRRVPEHVSKGGHQIGHEQVLVGVRVVLHDGVQKVENC